MRLLSWLVFTFVALLRIFYQLLILHCKIGKSFKMRQVTSLYFNFCSKIFIKCFKNSILLPGPNKTSVRSSYLFSLTKILSVVVGLKKLQMDKISVMSLCTGTSERNQMFFDMTLDKLRRVSILKLHYFSISETVYYCFYLCKRKIAIQQQIQILCATQLMLWQLQFKSLFLPLLGRSAE